MEEMAEVATIHSFCLNSILRYNSWRVPALKDGFKIVTADDEIFRNTVQSVRKKYRFQQSQDEKFQMVVRSVDGAALLPPGTLVPPAAFAEFWDLLEREGCMDFASVLYHSYLILDKFPQVASAISGEFEWILIDEFQDTTKVQLEIFRLIHAAGNSKFFLVGDPNQSIFGFAGARPDLIHKFAAEIGAKTGLQLSENWRSTAAIVADAEKICARVPEMECVPDVGRLEIPTVYIAAETLGSAVIGEFLPAVSANGIAYGDAAVLAQTWFQLFDLARELRAAGIPCTGPGSRPYKRSHLIARLLEDVCGYIAKRDGRIVSNLERQLFGIGLEVLGRPDFRAYSFAGRVLIFELINAGRQYAREDARAIPWIEKFTRKLADLLVAHEFIPESYKGAIVESGTQIIAEIQSNSRFSPNYSVSDLGFLADPRKTLKLLTIHAAKGREFEAVALGGLHDGNLPYGGARATASEVEEAARKFYVGITRARRMVYYITDSSKESNVPTRFLGKNWLGMV